MQKSILLLGTILCLTCLAPLFASYDPMQTSPDQQLSPPNHAHWLGTDAFGRDVFSRVLYGGQRTLLIATIATLLAAVPGTIIGLLAGFSNRRANKLIMAFINAALAFPGLLLALVILTLLGQGILPIIAATGAAQLVPYASAIRSTVLIVRRMTYVEAAYAAGATPLHILSRHIFPNIQPTLLAYTGIVFSYCILNSAALSFLGLAGEPGIPDWGIMLAEGRAAFRIAPWIGFVPGLAITITVLTVNTLVDHLTAPNTQ